MFQTSNWPAPELSGRQVTSQFNNRLHRSLIIFHKLLAVFLGRFHSGRTSLTLNATCEKFKSICSLTLTGGCICKNGTGAKDKQQFPWEEHKEKREGKARNNEKRAYLRR